MARQAWLFNQEGGGGALAQVDTALRTALGDSDFVRVLPGLHDLPMDLTFASDGRTLAAGLYDGTVLLWDLDHIDVPPSILDDSGEAVFTIAFQPDSAFLAVGRRGGTIQLWKLDAPGSPTILSVPSGEVSSLAFSTDGRTLAAPPG